MLEHEDGPLEDNELGSEDINYLKQVYGDDEESNDPEQSTESQKSDELQEALDEDLDLFGEPMVDPSKKSKAAKTPKEESKSQPETYDEHYICLVYNKRISVPESGLTLEQIRQWLEVTFPQFAANRTEMIVDQEQKYIIPTVRKGPAKG